MNIPQLTKEYEELRKCDMTVGERYSNVGQEKLDREWELLVLLSEAEGISTFDYTARYLND